MKVIFLDVDGTLNCTGCTEKYEGYYFVMPEKLELLQKLVADTNANLVLTSTWRKGWVNFQEGNTQTSDTQLFLALQTKLHEYGLELLDKTPTRADENRGLEIDEWLKSWDGEEIESFVILDDMNGKKLRPHASRLVRTSFTQGILSKHIEKAKKILNCPLNS